MPTNVYDVTFPPDTQLANLLGQDLRNFRLDVQQRMALISGTLAARWNPATDAQPANWAGLLYFATDTQQLFQWSGAVWVQIGFSSNIVASVNLTAQAAAIAATTLYAVPVGQSGLYRVTVDAITTTVGTTGTVSTTISWNNGVIALNAIGFQLNLTALGSEVGLTRSVGGDSVTVFAVGGTNIQYSTTFSNVTGAPQYSLRLRTEFLG